MVDALNTCAQEYLAGFLARSQLHRHSSLSNVCAGPQSMQERSRSGKDDFKYRLQLLPAGVRRQEQRQGPLWCSSSTVRHTFTKKDKQKLYSIGRYLVHSIAHFFIGVKEGLSIFGFVQKEVV
jgi:hypothetical protein